MDTNFPTYDGAPIVPPGQQGVDSIVVFMALDGTWSWTCPAECSPVGDFDTTAEALADARRHAARYSRVGSRTAQPVVILGREGVTL